MTNSITDRETYASRDQVPALATRPAVNSSRRRVLAGLLTAYTASLIPWASAAPVTGVEHGTFIALSAILAGRGMLNAELAARLHDALVAAEPHFDEHSRALLRMIEAQHIDPTRLQQALDAASSPLATLPRKIMRAWYLGLVGEGEAARCIAYENALDAVVVTGVLNPPTYAYGPYGSWSKSPVADEGAHHDDT